jgi:hypothetical protein
MIVIMTHHNFKNQTNWKVCTQNIRVGMADSIARVLFIQLEWYHNNGVFTRECYDKTMTIAVV